jgi:biopolymer transport protein TolR
MLRRGKKKRGFIVPEITLTPLIDTALTLLIIFMVSSPMMRMTIRVDLPDSSSSVSNTSRQEQDPLIVDIDANGQLYFAGLRVNVQQLKDQLYKIVRSYPKNNIVYINGDKSIKYQEIVRVIDAINSIEGVKHVALVTQKNNT